MRLHLRLVRAKPHSSVGSARLRQPHTLPPTSLVAHVSAVACTRIVGRRKTGCAFSSFYVRAARPARPPRSLRPLNPCLLSNCDILAAMIFHAPKRCAARSVARGVVGERRRCSTLLLALSTASPSRSFTLSSVQLLLLFRHQLFRRAVAPRAHPIPASLVCPFHPSLQPSCA